MGAQGVGDRAQRIVAAESEGAVDAHEHGLGAGPAVRAVRLAVLPQDHGRADLPLGEVVLERDLRVVQEGEQVITGPPQTLQQPPGIGVVDIRREQRIQPAADAYNPVAVRPAATLGLV